MNNLITPGGWTELHSAVWSQDLEGVKKIVNGGRQYLNSEDDRGWTALHLACTSQTSTLWIRRQSLPECSEPYERPGAEANYKKYTFEVPLSSALVKPFDIGHQEESVAFLIALELLQAGANVHATADIFTPLHCAAGSGWADHVSALLYYGAQYEFVGKCKPACLAAVRAAEGRLGARRVLALLQKKTGALRWEREKECHVCRFGGIPEYSWPPLDIVEWYIDDYDPNLSRGFLPGSNNAIDIEQNVKLCQLCQDISFVGVTSKVGYLHASSLQELSELAEHCGGCRFFWSLLKNGRSLDDKYNKNQVILRSTTDLTWNRTTATLRVQVAEGCYCNAGKNLARKSQAYTECRGTMDCRMMLLEDIAIDMFTGDDVRAQHLKLQYGKVPAADTRAEESMSTAKTWIGNCHQKHEKCKRVEGYPPLPRRLIDVGLLDSSLIRLAVDLQDVASYATLSHRWVAGDMPPWVTTTRNLEVRRSSFQLDSLPKSVRDAVLYTRALEIQYLWIDSLCILQDSAANWIEESAKMLNIFGNATITLFADCAANDDHGFLGPRPSAEFYRRKGLNFQMHQASGTPPLEVTLLQRYCRYEAALPAKALELFQSDTLLSTLSGRGWILQEQVVSQRRLHFGQHQMYWVCAEESRAEDGTFLPAVMPRWCRWSYKTPVIATSESKELPSMTAPPILSIPWDTTSRRIPLEYPRQRVFQSSTDKTLKAQHDDWCFIIVEYTKRALTHGTDRLPALSALSEQFGLKYQDKFSVGCWTKTLEWDMTWCSIPSSSCSSKKLTLSPIHDSADLLGRKPGSESKREGEQFPSWPSWSWTSVMRRVEYPHLKTTTSMFLHFVIKEKPNVHYSRGGNEFTTTPNSWSPMLITGFVLQASISVQPTPEKIFAPWDASGSDTSQHCIQVDLDGENFGYFIPDRPLHSSCDKVLLLSVLASEGICNCCGRIAKRENHFFVLEQCKSNCNHYTRIGYGWNSLRSKEFGGRYGIGQEKDPEDRWIKSAKMRTLSLV